MLLQEAKKAIDVVSELLGNTLSGEMLDNYLNKQKLKLSISNERIKNKIQENV